MSEILTFHCLSLWLSLCLSLSLPPSPLLHSPSLKLLGPLRLYHEVVAAEAACLERRRKVIKAVGVEPGHDRLVLPQPGRGHSPSLLLFASLALRLGLSVLVNRWRRLLVGIRAGEDCSTAERWDARVAARVNT